jgi:hypothetical protein
MVTWSYFNDNLPVQPDETLRCDVLLCFELIANEILEVL